MNGRKPIENNDKTAIIIGMKPWKKLWPTWFDETHRIGFSRFFSPLWFRFFIAPRILKANAPHVYVWGMKYPSFLKDFCASHAIPFTHVEDGFIRSANLGKERQPPLSLAIDHNGMHFNAEKPSDLENLLQSFDFSNYEPEFHKRTQKALDTFLQTGISKYNMGASPSPDVLYGKKERYRIMIIGQVAGDASLQYGNPAHYTEGDLLRIAQEEHPSAQIIYRPHPAAKRELLPFPSIILSENVSLHAALETIDHVYTRTSLAGFEALLRGKKATIFGTPFYAGWGLTDDRSPLPLRTNRLTVLEIFAAAYLLYPHYYDPQNGKKIAFEDALNHLLPLRKR